MFPLPTPAITMPLAPPSALASIRSGYMSSSAKMMSTRGSFVTFDVEFGFNVCFHGGSLY